MAGEPEAARALEVAIDPRGGLAFGVLIFDIWGTFLGTFRETFRETFRGFFLETQTGTQRRPDRGLRVFPVTLAAIVAGRHRGEQQTDLARR